jgi:hypothetical protein
MVMVRENVPVNKHLLGLLPIFGRRPKEAFSILRRLSNPEATTCGEINLKQGG